MKICVINPNSDESMTEVIQTNARNFAAGDFEVDCITNVTAPPFIGCYEDAHDCTQGMVDIVKKHQNDYDAFIVACHSDPGLDLLREISVKPVVGICEASMKIATMIGHSFSVVSSGERGIPNKEALCRKYGVESSLASCVGPTDFQADWKSEEGFIEAGKRAMKEDQCEVLVLGCAGMGHLTGKMQEALGIPVLDGVTCALIIASGLVKAGIPMSKIRRYHKRGS